MPIPDYQSILLPMLELSGDGKEHRLKDARDSLADQFALTSEERREKPPGKPYFVFGNRVGWARHYLVKAGLLKSTRRGYFRITERGLDLLQTKPDKLDSKRLKAYPEFAAFVNRS